MKLPDKLTLAYIEGLTDTQLSHLTLEQTKRVMQHLAMVANKRLERLRKTEITYSGGEKGSLVKQSQSARELKRGFSASPKTLGAKKVVSESGEVSYKGYLSKLRKEIRRATAFIRSKSSQVSGTREIQKEIEAKIGEFDSEEQAVRFWETYKKILEEYPELKKSAGGNTNVLVEKVYKTMFFRSKSSHRRVNPLSVEDTYTKMREYLENRYRKKEGQNNNANPLSIARAKKPKGTKSTIHTKFETIYPFGKK